MGGDEGIAVDRFWTECLRLALFLLPLAYVANVFAVAVHELIGHGITALLLEGEFRGFMLEWDGMGRASASVGAYAPLSHQVLVFAGGMISTTVCGMALFTGSLFAPRCPHLQLALLIFALFLLLEGPPYAFWNAWHPSPPGDVHVMLTMLRDAGEVASSRSLRWFLMASGGLISIVVIVIGSLLLFRGIEGILSRGQSLRGLRRAIILMMFVALPGAAGWLMFDWNQIADGIGRLPAMVGALSVVVMALFMYWKSLAPSQYWIAVRTRATHIGIAWAGCLATAISILLFFRKGVMF